MRQILDTVSTRRQFWERHLSGPAGQAALNNEPDLADSILTTALDADHSPQGRVTLVGAGPGDASLLTLKGLQRLQEADVVLYDKLVRRCSNGGRWETPRPLPNTARQY